MSMSPEKLKNIVEAALMAAGQPLSIDRLISLFVDEHQPSRDEVRTALDTLARDCDGRGIELTEVASGFRYQSRGDYAVWVSRLWEEKPQRYSRALLETLALIAYRQPITRAEIEDIRGVTVSTNIMKTLQERDWVRVVGHRDVPGKPAMYATTRQFLDYFNLKGLDQLPPLSEIKDIDSINAELDFGQVTDQGTSAPADVADTELADIDSEVATADDDDDLAGKDIVVETMADDAFEHDDVSAGVGDTPSGRV